MSTNALCIKQNSLFRNFSVARLPVAPNNCNGLDNKTRLNLGDYK